MLFSTLHLRSNADELPPSTPFDGEPRANISNCVNAITGKFHIAEIDLHIAGREPLSIPRLYVEKTYDGHLIFFPHTKLEETHHYKRGKYRIEIQETTGKVLHYRSEKLGSRSLCRLSKKNNDFRGVTNTSCGKISGRTNIYNRKLTFNNAAKIYTLHLGDGTKRFYKKSDVWGKKWVHPTKVQSYVLHHERLPNGNCIYYEYDKRDVVKKIYTTDPTGEHTYAWATFQFDHEKNPGLIIRSSDQRWVEYYFADERAGERGEITRQSKNLEKICWSNGIVERIEMAALVKSRRYAKRGKLEILRYEKKKEHNGDQKVLLKSHGDSKYRCVKSLRAPLSKTGEMITSHRFFYHPKKSGGLGNKHGQGHTEVFDAEGNRTRYTYSKSMRHQATDYYLGRNTPLFHEYFFWKRGGDLRAKYYKNPDGTPYLTRNYNYDKQHNIKEEIIVGNLSGKNPGETYCKEYEYTTDSFNLLSKKREGDNEVQIAYLEKTNLPIKKLNLYKGKIYKRHYHFYDKYHRLTHEFFDDGTQEDPHDLSNVTMRKISYYDYSDELHILHYLEAKTEKYLDTATSDENLIKKTKYFYDKMGNLNREETYDAKEQLYSFQTSEYDENGNLLKETNALGECIERKYDRYQFPIMRNDPNGLITTISYDKCFREVSRVQKAEGYPKRAFQNQYDTKSHLRKKIEPGGKVTKTYYDPLGNLLTKKHLTDGQWSQTEATYNLVGKPLTEVDGNGNLVKKEYNCRGQLTRIDYPDGSCEQIVYNLDGTVEKKLDRAHRLTIFEYDYQKRPLKKTRYCTKGFLLNEEHFTYTTFHLLSTTKNGITTSYQYDGAGRKVQETKTASDESITTTYLYNSMGRVKEQIQKTDNTPARITQFFYDKLNRATLEIQKDEKDKIFQEVAYTYDTAGNKTSITTINEDSKAEEQYVYDPFNRLIKSIDVEGQDTIIEYLEKDTLIKKIHGPQNRLIIEYYNEADQLKKREVYHQDTLLQAEEYRYDANSNKIEQISHVGNKRKTTSWTYNSNNDVIAFRQHSDDAGLRTTTYSYTKDRKLKKVEKSNGNTLRYTYNGKGFEESLEDDFGTIHYTINYDTYDFLSSVMDHIHDCESVRKTHPFGFLLKERLANGYTLQSTYNLNGEKTSLKLPDKSQIEYTYDTYNLTKIKRRDPQGKKLYQHHYLIFERGGKPLVEEMIGNLGKLEHHYKPTSQETLRTTPYSKEEYLKFDPSGNLLAKALTLEGKTTTTKYQYDHLDQLIFESGPHSHTYTYDAHFNRLSKDRSSYEINDLNQVSSDGETKFLYDTCGRPVQNTTKKTSYTYDGLDRLTQIQTPLQTIHYQYDYWNRRVTKKVNEKAEHYLYDGNNEIGKIQNGKITELRILGIGQGAEVGAAVAVELKTQIYAPLHSISGNLIALIDPYQKKIISQIAYTAFGEQHPQGELLPPWRYQSKRHDPETSLTYFGRRYYDASLGRFFTPDPKGLPEIPNPYTFVLNNPLLTLDLYGLEPLYDGEFSWAQPETLGREGNHYDPPVTGEDVIVEYYEQFLASRYPEQPPEGYLSSIHDLGRPELPNHEYNIHINGIKTKLAKFFTNMEHISDLSGGYNAHGVHNATHGFRNDTFECLMMLHGIATEPVLLLKDLITDKLSSHEDAMANLIAHSQGAIAGSLTMRMLPEELRNKVTVINIAPAKFISNNECKEAFNYVSRDFVPKLQNHMAPRNSGLTNVNIIALKPHRWYTIWDHDFLSPTYAESLSIHLRRTK